MQLKNKSILISGVFMALVALSSFKTNNNTDALAILKKSENHLLADNVVALLKVNIIRPGWTKSIELKSWAKGKDKALAYITSPEKDKGTVFLKNGDELYNYLPKVKKVIKMPMNVMSQYWMGTDMSTDDLIKGSQFSEDYAVKLNGEENVLNNNCYRLILTPKEDAEVLWGQVELWIDKASYNQLKLKFYDEDLALIHTITAKEMKSMGGRLLVSKYLMLPADKNGYSTQLEYMQVDFNQKLSDDFFSKENMKNVRP